MNILLIDTCASHMLISLVINPNYCVGMGKYLRIRAKLGETDLRALKHFVADPSLRETTTARNSNIRESVTNNTTKMISLL